LISKNVLARFFMVYQLSDENRQRATVLLSEWLRSGLLQHNIGARFPLDRIAAAHSMVESGKAVGNVLISVDSMG
jgi:NADPH2:quinone reductase